MSIATYLNTGLAFWGGHTSWLKQASGLPKML